MEKWWLASIPSRLLSLSASPLIQSDHLLNFVFYSRNLPGSEFPHRSGFLNGKFRASATATIANIFTPLRTSSPSWKSTGETRRFCAKISKLRAPSSLLPPPKQKSWVEKIFKKYNRKNRERFYCSLVLSVSGSVSSKSDSSQPNSTKYDDRSTHAYGKIHV